MVIPFLVSKKYVGKREMICEEAQLRLASSFMGSSSPTGSTPYPGQGVYLFQRQKLKSQTILIIAIVNSLIPRLPPVNENVTVLLLVADPQVCFNKDKDKDPQVCFN